jgi:hypothetical protein
VTDRLTIITPYGQSNKRRVVPGRPKTAVTTLPVPRNCGRVGRAIEGRIGCCSGSAIS